MKRAGVCRPSSHVGAIAGWAADGTQVGFGERHAAGDLRTRRLAALESSDNLETRTELTPRFGL